MELTFDDKLIQLKNHQIVEYKNTNNTTLDRVCFNIYGNAYRQNAKIKPIPMEKFRTTFVNGESYGNLSIHKVKVDNKLCKFELLGCDENFLTVFLDTPLKKGEKISIEIESTLNLANCNHRLGYTKTTVNLGNFYPILAPFENGSFVECAYYPIGDPFYSECSDYFVTLNSSSKYTVGSSGKIAESYEKGENTITNYKQKNIRDFALTLSQNYNVKKENYKGVDISYLYIFDSNYQNSFDTIKNSIDTFNELFGKYPYPTLTVSEIPFSSGGMEYPCHVFIDNSLTGEDRTTVIVHEIAHQWWYGIVGVNQLEHSYIDEGLAEYSTTLFFERNKDYGITRKQRIQEKSEGVKSYLWLKNQINSKPQFEFQRHLGKYSTEFDYVFTNYCLGEIFFDDMRNLVGDKDFYKFLKTLYRENKYKIIDSETIVSTMESISSINVQEYVNSYINGSIKIK